VLLLWRPWRWHLSRADAKSVVLYGAALGGMNLMFYMSLRTLPFGLAVAIEFAGPLAVAIWSSRRAVDFVWVLLAIAGLGLLLPLGLNGSMLDPVGVAYALGAAVFWALYIVFGKRAGHLHAGHSVSLGLLVAALVVVPVGVAHAGAALLSPSRRGGGGGVQRSAHIAGDDGPEAPAQGGLRHHDQHGTRRGRAGRHGLAERAPERGAVAGHWLHHGRLDGQRAHGACARSAGGGAATGLSTGCRPSALRAVPGYLAGGAPRRLSIMPSSRSTSWCILASAPTRLSTARTSGMMSWR